MPFVFTFILSVLLLHIMKNKRKQDSNNEGSKKKKIVERSVSTQNHVTPLEDITSTGTQFMGLGMDWVTELDADPPTADADPPTADADPPMADAVMPFANSYSQLE